MNWNDVALELVQALLPIVTAALIALIGYGIAYLRKQAEKIDNEVAQQAIFGALAEAEKVAKDAVTATNQKLVDDLKAKSDDGKLTKEEALQAMEEARDYFINHISANSKEILEAALGPIQAWLDDYLEAKLGEQKQIQARVSKIANPTSPVQAG